MQKLQLSIPEPCHQNWQRMTPTEQGRFCNACAKEVIDFSTMTDIQVLNYFSSMTHEKVCGRVLPEQLDRTISRPEQPKKKLFWYWNYFVMFFMFFAKGNSAKAQSCRAKTGSTQVITAVDLDKIRSTNINDALAGRVGGLVVINNKIITGKVTDVDENPVSFASIKVKGTNTGVSADADGAYSVKVNSNDVLIISAAGFKEVEFNSGTQSILNTVLEKAFTQGLGEVVISSRVGQVKRNITCGTSTVKTSIINPIIIFVVKEDNTGLPIYKTAIIITRKVDNLSNKYFSDKKGIYEFKQIKLNDSYFVKVEAEGYEPNEFTIDASDFKDRKKEWEVLLRKTITQSAKPTAVAVSGTQASIRLGGVSVIDKSNAPLYVIDGIITKKTNDINPDDIDNITILKGSEAMVLFGSDGLNGAIVITTKKIKCKVLDTVTVTADNKRIIICTSESTSTVMGAAIKGVSVKNNIADSLKVFATKITGAIKVYPNPVQRNQQFNIVLKLKQAGLYQMQITDAAGRIVLQKPINTILKEVTEKITAGVGWSSGAYYISIIDNKNKLISSTSFIFE